MQSATAGNERSSIAPILRPETLIKVSSFLLLTRVPRLWHVAAVHQPILAGIRSKYWSIFFRLDLKEKRYDGRYIWFVFKTPLVCEYSY